MLSLLAQGWLLVVAGAVLVGSGGVLATLGWNKLNLKGRLDAVVAGVAREWDINDVLVRKEPLFVSDNLEVQQSYRLYPRFSSGATKTALSSGLFRTSDPKQKEFLRALADYDSLVADVNARLAVSDGFVVSTRDRVAIAKHRQEVRSSKGFASFTANHQKLRDALKKNYPSAISDNFLE